MRRVVKVFKTPGGVEVIYNDNTRERHLSEFLVEGRVRRRPAASSSADSRGVRGNREIESAPPGSPELAELNRRGTDGPQFRLRSDEPEAAVEANRTDPIERATGAPPPAMPPPLVDGGVRPARPAGRRARDARRMDPAPSRPTAEDRGLEAPDVTESERNQAAPNLATLGLAYAGPLGALGGYYVGAAVPQGERLGRGMSAFVEGTALGARDLWSGPLRQRLDELSRELAEIAARSALVPGLNTVYAAGVAAGIGETVLEGNPVRISVAMIMSIPELLNSLESEEFVSAMRDAGYGLARSQMEELEAIVQADDPIEESYLFGKFVAPLVMEIVLFLGTGGPATLTRVGSRLRGAVRRAADSIRRHTAPGTTWGDLLRDERGTLDLRALAEAGSRRNSTNHVRDLQEDAIAHEPTRPGDGPDEPAAQTFALSGDAEGGNRMLSVSGTSATGRSYVRGTLHENSGAEQNPGHAMTFVNQYREHSGGIAPPRHGRDVRGVRGSTYASHAELQDFYRQNRSGTNFPVGVSRDMCGSCRRFFRRAAMRYGRRIDIADPSYRRIFNTDGSVEVYSMDNDRLIRDVAPSEEPSVRPSAQRYTGIDW